jgi:hypothetical protein
MTYMDVGNVNVDARFSGRNEMSPVSPYLVLRYTLAKFELINEGDDSGTHVFDVFFALGIDFKANDRLFIGVEGIQYFDKMMMNYRAKHRG